jgi:multiple sugar transport system permease protein
MDETHPRRTAAPQTLADRLHLSPQLRNDIAGYLFITPWVIKFLFLIAGAMIASLGVSFLQTDFLNEFQFVGLGNYGKLAQDPLFWQSMKVTAIYTFGMVPLSLAFALTIALVLNQKVKGLGAYRTIYYLPSIVAGVAVAILWRFLLNPRWGLVNQGLGLLGIEGPKWILSTRWAVPSFIMMGVWGAGGNMLLYLAGLQGIPTTLYEAAKIDGANAWYRFWRITLPMLTPTIFFNLIMTIIGAWQVFTQSYVMTQGGPNNATLTMVLLIYRKAFERFHFGYASAIAWVLFAIVMVFTVLVIRSSEAWVYYAGELR